MMAVYFAQLPTGAVKIGKADNVEVRLEQLEAHYRQPLALLHTIEGGRETEHEMHKRFAHLRILQRGEREQFQPAPDLMEFIGKPLLVSANPAAVEAVSPWSDRPAGRKIRIAVTFDSDVYERIVKEAEEQDRTIAATVNRALRSAWKIPYPNRYLDPLPPPGSGHEDGA